MFGFGPVRKKPRQFNYTPRYYDPVKERWEQRRAELRGETLEESKTASEEHAEYVPGQFVRRAREARSMREEEQGSGRKPLKLLPLIVVLLFLFIVAYVLVPRVLDMFSGAKSNVPTQQESGVIEQFDPYAPIQVVPNDYVEPVSGGEE